MITKKDVVYISGPMTGIADFNRRSFLAAARLIEILTGATVVNPADLPDGMSWTEYMRIDLEMLGTATAVIALPDWQASRGARIEIDWAIQAGLHILELKA